MAAVYDATDNSLSLYVNGEAQESQIEVNPFNETAKTSWIGRGATSWFAGDIADVRVWFRVATETEIADDARPTGPVVNWQFEDQSTTGVVVDSSGNGAHGTVTGGVAYTDEGHPTPEGNADIDRGAVSLNGTNGAVTTRARLLTDQSFTVAGWVRLDDGTRDATAVGQDGGLQLKYAAACRCWTFTLPGTDGGGPVTVAATAEATLNTWTHLAGVYDAAAGTATLYVDDNPVATATASTSGNATGEFAVGRTKVGDKNREWFAGEIDDVLAYQGVLDGFEIGALMREGPSTE